MYLFLFSSISFIVLLLIKHEHIKKKKKPIPSDISHAMACNLPGDAMIAILLRCSVQSLVKLRNVSKSWNQLTKSNAFAYMHLKHSLSRNNISILHLSETPLIDDYFGCPPIRYVHAICYDTLHAFIDLRLPHNGYFEIVGCCNGVLCLTTDAEWWHEEDYKTNPNRLEQCGCYLLINPATREHKLIQGFTKTRLESGNYKGKKVYGGFGFDSRTNDYKIIRIVKLFTPNGLSSFAEIYNLSSESWRKLDADANFNLRDSNPTFFNGILHFEAADKGNPSLITFNIRKEVFRKMKLPSFKLSSLWKVTVYKEQLAVVCTHFVSERTCFQMWIMQKYGDQNSWESQMIVTGYNDLRYPVGVWKNGEILSVNVRSKLSMLDLDDDSTKEIHVWALVSKRLVTYTESLVTFGGSYVYPDQRKPRNNHMRKQQHNSWVLFLVLVFLAVPSSLMIARLMLW